MIPTLKRTMTQALFFLLFSSPALGFFDSGPVDPLPDIVEKISPSVVNLSSIRVITYQMPGWDEFMLFWGIPRERKQTSLGSGMIIDPEGLILTNDHVVRQATEVLVTFLDKKTYRAQIVGRDEKLDLALLKIKLKNPTRFQPVRIGDSETVRIGETVFAVGNPFGLQNTVTKGIISAKHRTIGLGPYDNFLQTDASVNPGNSGGPLFNLKGEVIGINTAIRSDTGQNSGLSFSLPTNEAKRVLPDLKKFGYVIRPWLGIVGEPMNSQLQQYYQLPVEKGVLIYRLARGGPASKAGIRQGDIIVGINGKPMTDTQEIERELKDKSPKDRVQLSYVRENTKVITVELELGQLPKLEGLPQGVI